jgi:carboxypeptidase C (cathepsin A)
LAVTRYQRWLSPKFVIGESYGTTRAAALASHLQQATGLDLVGVVLLSSALDFQTFSPGEGNDLPYALALPSFTAAAWYHKKLAADPAQALTEVEHWALTEYTTALAQGDVLASAERDHIIARMAEFTGLSANYLQTSRLRVRPPRFAKELLRGEDRTLGLLDSRVRGVDVSPRGEFPEYDPAMFLVTGPYVATFNDYVRRDLKYETTLRYEFLSQEYTLDHLELDPSLRGHLTFKLYHSGHHIYTDIPSLRALKSDLAAFVRSARTPASSAPAKGKPGARP